MRPASLLQVILLYNILCLHDQVCNCVTDKEASYSYCLLIKKFLPSLVGASLSEPHTSGRLGTIIMYTNNYQKKRTISIFSWYGRFTYTNNHEKKWTISIFRLVLFFMSRKKQTQLTDASYLIGTVVRVANNNDCSLLIFHIWLVGSFLSRSITS